MTQTVDPMNDPNTPLVDVIGTLIVVPVVVIALSGVFPLVALTSEQTAGNPTFTTVVSGVWLVASSILAGICGHAFAGSMRARRSTRRDPRSA